MITEMKGSRLTEGGGYKGEQFMPKVKAAIAKAEGTTKTEEL